MACEHFGTLTWRDCDKHPSGDCFARSCADCDEIADRDCEDCEICLGVIAGGNPFSRRCDSCLEQVS